MHTETSGSLKLRYQGGVIGDEEILLILCKNTKSHRLGRAFFQFTVCTHF